uniref:Uncharacterized protein n=1 Tax=Oryza sativa subsp. japonica TaxID=39947 RepID=Q7Y0F8_ORYSJ|nr:hypothetical protein [Oryza sativa Japonica Group]
MGTAVAAACAASGDSGDSGPRGDRSRWWIQRRQREQAVAPSLVTAGTTDPSPAMAAGLG